jgi:hypothetical protein
MKFFTLNVSIHTFIPTSSIMAWGSHGGEYEDGCLLGCSAMKTGMSLPTFQRSVLLPSSERFPARGFIHRPDDGGSTDLWNVGKLVPVYTALQPRRQPSSTSSMFGCRRSKYDLPYSLASSGRVFNSTYYDGIYTLINPTSFKQWPMPIKIQLITTIFMNKE